MFHEVPPLPHTKSRSPPPPPPSCASQPFDFKKSCGVCCCIVGAFWYARLKQQAPQASAAAPLLDVTMENRGSEGKST